MQSDGERDRGRGVFAARRRNRGPRHRMDQSRRSRAGRGAPSRRQRSGAAGNSMNHSREQTDGRTRKSKSASEPDVPSERAAGLRFGIVVSQFNVSSPTAFWRARSRLFRVGRCAKNKLKSCACRDRSKFPSPRKKWRRPARFDSLMCIGCVLRGETSHYDYVASETARGIQLAQLDTGVPDGILRAHLRHARAGHRPRRRERWQQRLRGRSSAPSKWRILRASILPEGISGTGTGPQQACVPQSTAPMSSLRHKSREFALQMLFEWDMTRQEPARVKSFSGIARAHVSEETRKFANHLFEAAVAKNRPRSIELVERLVGKLAARPARRGRPQHPAPGDLRTAHRHRHAAESRHRRSPRTRQEILVRRSSGVSERHPGRRPEEPQKRGLCRLEASRQRS